MAKGGKAGKDGAPWRNRIVGHGEEAPDQLLANPRNFRLHPKNQQDALAGVLREVGIVDEVLVNQRSGFVVDGHLRVAMAISERQPTVPVTYLDLSDEEEALILATFDPISAMAAADKEQLDALLRDVSTGEAAVQAMLADLAKEAGLEYDGGESEPEKGLTPPTDLEYRIIVECEGEQHQAELLERLEGEGIKCRPLIS